MIGKIVKGRSFKGCVSYVLGSKDAKLLASEGVLKIDTKSIINSFYMQSLMNPNLSKSVGHIPLAFSPEDIPRLTETFRIPNSMRFWMRTGKCSKFKYNRNQKDQQHQVLRIWFQVWEVYWIFRSQVQVTTLMKRSFNGNRR